MIRTATATITRASAPTQGGAHISTAQLQRPERGLVPVTSAEPMLEGDRVQIESRGSGWVVVG